MNMTVESCDDSGNIEGKAYITTVEGQGYDQEWVNYYFKGTVDPQTNAFHMKGTKEIDSNSSTSWTLIPFDGYLNGDYISGIADNNSERTFYFGRVSEWAKAEVTEAKVNNLIPETIKGKDLSKPVTRAEFAAVSVKLYETLSGTESEGAETPFTDISGSINLSDIEKAYGLNIAVGISNTKFAPDTSISREQLATMLCRTIKKYKFADWTYADDAKYYLDSEGVELYNDDGDILGYAKPSVYYMKKMGIINGYEDNRFAPRNITEDDEASGYATATREQAIILSLRIYKLSSLWG